MRLPLQHLRVAGSFFATFWLLLLVLLLWYDFTSLSHDPRVLFAWFGMAYLLAYSVAEVARKRTFFAALGLLCASTFVAVDIARHGNLIIQNGVLTARHWVQLSSTQCAASGSTEWLCQVTMFLVLGTRFVILCAAVGMLVALTGNLAGVLRNRMGKSAR